MIRTSYVLYLFKNLGPSLCECIDSDAVRLYLVGKDSCWHAGVLLAAPTVRLVHAEVCMRV
jgi:hypothetical protein